MDVPKNIDQCKDLESTMEWIIDDNKDNEDFDDWTGASEESAVALSHHGLGRWLRNTLNLWQGGTVAKYFNEIGIYHADDMSSIIVTSVHRKLNNKDLELDVQIKEYRDFWEKSDPNVNIGKFE